MIENNIRYLGYPIEEIETDENNILLSTLDTLYKSILNSPEYKSLEGKTQLLNIGVNDSALGLTTRMIHDIHVSQNAMKMAKKLHLDSEQILKAQIMGIAHDLGMPPFGHDGEEALNEVLNEIDKNYGFSHSEYGTEILEKRIETLNENKEADIYKKYDEKYIESIKEELKKGVKQHSIYYSYQAKGETIEQKCVRLADTLSFMASDLSDIIRASDKGVIQYNVPIEQIYDMLDDNQKEKMNEVLEGLKEGGEKLAKIHEKLIKEAFSKKRNSAETCVIIDDYKKLREIKNKYKILKKEKEDTTKTKNDLINIKGELLQSIEEYYKYLVENKKRAIPNEKFMEILKEKVGEENHEKRSDKLKGIANLMMNYGIDEEIGENLLADELLEENIKEQAERIQKRELGDCPTLMSIFMLQDKIVYEDILENKKDVLKNEPQKVKENISKMFKNIVNLSYIAKKKPEYLKTDKKPDLTLYNGEKVPNLENCNEQIIKYTTYAVQQMTNDDFSNEKKLQKIAEELGIAEEKIDEILEMDTKEILIRIRNEKERKSFLEKISDTNEILTTNEKNEERKDGTDPLEYTEKEKKAIEVYEGIQPGVGPLSSKETAHETINMMFFEGVKNEKIRVLEEYKKLIPEAILHPEELLEVSTNLYSAMYKYGKKMNSTQKTFRIDRIATIEEMEKLKEIPSYFSTSKREDLGNGFKKKNQVMEEVYINPNVICIDFEDILKNDYTFIGEREILVAPGNKVEKKEEEITEKEKNIRALDGKETKHKYKITIEPPIKAKPLTDEEKKEKDKAMEIFTDTNYRKQAATYLFDLMQFANLKNPKSIDEEIDISEKDAYLKFKEAFQKIYKYKTREIALNIEEQLKEKNEKELYELTTERGIKQMKKTSEEIMKITAERTEERKRK